MSAEGVRLRCAVNLSGKRTELNSNVLDIL